MILDKFLYNLSDRKIFRVMLGRIRSMLGKLKTIGQKNKTL